MDLALGDADLDRGSGAGHLAEGARRIAGTWRGSMTCTEPIDAALLADYWMHLVSIEAEVEMEEHLLACDECGTRLREVIALADGVRQLVRNGTVRLARRSGF